MFRTSRVSLLAAFAFAACAAFGAFGQQSNWTQTSVIDAYSLVGSGGPGGVLIANRREATGLSARSTDGGRTWTTLSVDGTRIQLFVASPSNPAVFYAMSGGYLDGGVQASPVRLHTSTDGGATWQLVSSSLRTERGDTLGNLAPGGQLGLVYATTMSPTACFTGFCSFGGVAAYISTDGARTWRSIDAALSASSGVKLIPAPSNPQVVYAATGAGLYRSENQGTTWQLVRSIAGVDERQVVVDRLNSSTVYVRPGSSTELLITEDGGANWRATTTLDFPGSFGYIITDPGQAGRVFVVGPSGGTIQSRDRGQTWSRVTPTSGAPMLVISGAPPALVLNGLVRSLLGVNATVLKRIEITEETFAVGSDLWWNPVESGSGWTITQHASGQMFVVWYGHDSTGQPTWKVMPGGIWSDQNTYRGTLYSAKGPAYFGGAFDASRVTVTPVGEAVLRFEGDSQAVFSWTSVDGAGEKRIIRQLFGPPTEVPVENFADLWWTPSESGWGLAINHQFGKIFAAWFVYDGAGNPSWLVMPDMNLDIVNVGGIYLPKYSGRVYSARGSSTSTQVQVTDVGSASITFRSQEQAELAYSVNGSMGSKTVHRQPF